MAKKLKPPEEEEHVGPGGDDGRHTGSPAEEYEGGRRGGSCKYKLDKYKYELDKYKYELNKLDINCGRSV